jgi:class 3 adenylate cyclase/tetratricopeptide (TPR) repeat protein
VEICAVCGQANPEGFRFCGACGASLVDAPAREERKIVTALFCDLVGFTSRAEQLDPEDVRALVRPYWEHVRAELERYGGTVEKFIGDAVMALFGAPTAHEDDPERAVRAALAIRDWSREQDDVQVRIGVSTGEALVRVDADAARGEGMASGDVVNTAARLQAAAPVDGVVVGETTWRATSQAIEYAEREAVIAKGKSEPVRVWEPLQARSRVGVDVVQQSRTPLVGRQRELDALFDALSRAHEGQTVQLVTLVGVPGIGKSRLVYELALAQRALVTWRQGRSLPYGEGVAMWALGEIVKAEANIYETDAVDEVEEKLAQSVDDDWVLRHLRTLVGIADDRSGSRDEAFAAWREYLETLAERRPTVLVFEDLHWADDALLEFVDQLVDYAADVPLLVLATARPELLERRPGWGGGKRNATTLSLDPLDAGQTAQLAGALVDWSALPEQTRSIVLERAEGNPLYAEQFVRALLERTEPALPETVQGIIAARLDALPAGEKELLQNAAVLGKVFWTGALEVVGPVARGNAEALLHSLVRKEFVRRERRPSIQGENEWAFRHVLTRDVAYSQIPRVARADKHVRTADWIESLGRPDDHAEMIAHHRATALELARAAGQPADALASAAYAALRIAGDRAAALNANPSAARFYARALELAPESDAPELLYRRARALYYAGDDAVEALVEAEQVLAAAGEAAHAGEAAALAAEAEWFAHGTDASRPHVARALERVNGLPPSPGKARVLLLAARAATFENELEDAVARGREALELSEGLGLADVTVGALSFIGIARARLGDLNGVGDLELALERGIAADVPETARTANNLAAVLGEIGHLDRCAEVLDEAIRLAERYGNMPVRTWALGGRMGNQQLRGLWDDAWARAITIPDAGYWTRSIRGDIAFSRGDLAAGLADIAAGIEDGRDFGGEQFVQAAAPAVRIYADAGDGVRARALLDEILQVPSHGLSAGYLIDPALVADELDATDEVARELERALQTEWVLAARELLRGEHATAAERLARMGTPMYEAHALLRSRERELLLRAAQLFGGLGASFYVERTESLLATVAA